MDRMITQLSYTAIKRKWFGQLTFKMRTRGQFEQIVTQLEQWLERLRSLARRPVVLGMPKARLSADREDGVAIGDDAAIEGLSFALYLMGEAGIKAAERAVGSWSPSSEVSLTVTIAMRGLT